MTILGPETLKAIEAHKAAQRLAERNRRLFDLKRRQMAYQARQLAGQGYGREDVRLALMSEHGIAIGEANDIAKAAVFGRGK